MGDWNIVVAGTGAHHNTSRDEEWRRDHDADDAFQEFVEKLKAQGHRIHHASFVSGGRDQKSCC